MFQGIFKFPPSARGVCMQNSNSHWLPLSWHPSNQGSTLIEPNSNLQLGKTVISDSAVCVLISSISQFSCHCQMQSILFYPLNIMGMCMAMCKTMQQLLKQLLLGCSTLRFYNETSPKAATVGQATIATELCIGFRSTNLSLQPL